MPYIFVFGNAPELSSQELSAVLQREGIDYRQKYFSPPVLWLETDRNLTEKEFRLLGGTVKVATIFSSADSESQLVGKISEKLSSQKGANKIDFGLSYFGSQNSPEFLGRLCKEIKNYLVKKGIKARFVLPEFGNNQLSSVVVQKQKLEEILIILQNGQIHLAQTTWVQDFEDWGKRDYGRPQVQGHMGMLPPKVARMMVNISLPIATNSEPTILDPFCGVGTILAEAMMVGANAIGADIDITQLQKTEKNLIWLTEEYQLSKPKFQLFPADASKISEKLEKGVDAIVTEPFLGPNDLTIRNYSQNKLDNLITQLIDIYESCLENWRDILTEKGKIVIVIPSFNISKDKEVSPVKTVIDKAKLMGYSLQIGPFPYFRPQAVVRRNIIVLEVKN